MNDQFAESLFHRKHSVCGVRLKPYSFAHAAILDFARSPYSSMSGSARLEDIVFALSVLGEKPSRPNQIPTIGFFRRWIITFRVFRAGIDAAHNQLMAYLDDYNSPPQMWQKENTRPVKTPWMLYFVAVLMRHGQMTEREAWSCEVGYGRWLCAGLAEAGGNDVPIITDEERAAMKEAGHG